MTAAEHDLSTTPAISPSNGAGPTAGPDTSPTAVAAATPPVRPAPAPPPKAPAAAGYLGAICALGIIALGVIGIHDGIAAAGWISGPRWTHAAVTWVNGQHFHLWMIPVGVVAVVLGLACLYVAVKPRRHRAVPLSARTSVYLELSDAARVAAAAARSVPGVTKATARARRRKHTIHAHTTGADPAAQHAAIADAVTDALAPLAKTPKLRVRTRIGGRS